jgi:ribosome-binding factor A
MVLKRPAAAAPREKASNRLARVAAQLRQEIARFVSRELADPRLEGFLVASVVPTQDLKQAKVFYRIATTETGAAHEALKKGMQVALEKASGRMRKAVTDRLKLRSAPELKFVYDAGQDARDRIDALLEEVKRERSE